MDLGATVCRPRSPLCLVCPVGAFCAAYVTAAPETYPRKAAKAARPRRYGAAYILKRGNAIALVRRPDKGLLGGMLGLPTTEWGDAALTDDAAVAAAPVVANWRKLGEIEHVFTHFALTLAVYEAEGDMAAEWTGDLSGLPTVFRKATRLA